MEVLGEEYLLLDEQVDKKALRTIAHNFDLLYERGALGVMKDAKKAYAAAANKEQFKTIFMKFYKRCMKKSEVKYMFARGCKGGRLFSDGPSLQNIARPVRHAIAKDLYADIDIENCHPVILLKYCADNKLPVPSLRHYVANRNKCLAELMEKTLDGRPMSRDEAKAFPLAVINGGKRGHWFEKGAMPDWLQGMENEINHVVYPHMKAQPWGMRYYKRVKEHKTEEENVAGSVVNLKLCEEENKILTQLVWYLVRNGCKIGAYCFDGLMVYKTPKWEPEKMLPRMEEIVRDELGYELKITCKEMAEAVDLSGLGCPEEVDTSDCALADYCLTKMDVLFHAGRKELHLFDSEVALWRTVSKEALQRICAEMAIEYIEQNVIVDEERLKLVDALRNDSRQKRIRNVLWSTVAARQDDLQIDTRMNALPGFLPVRGKQVLNLKTGKCKPRLATHYFSEEIDLPLLEDDEADEAFVYEYLGGFLGTKEAAARREYIECLLDMWAYTMSGENSLKRFNLMVGNRNAGKSLVTKVMMKMLGPLARSVNERVFRETKNKSCHDSDKFSMLGKRAVVTSELSESEQFNEQLVKAISGRDPTEFRRAGAPDVCQIELNCVIYMHTNQVPQFRCEAFGGRMCVWNARNEFEPDGGAFEAKLMSMVPHFFAVTVKRCKQLYDNGMQFELVDEVKAASVQVRKDKDTVAQFFEEQSTFEEAEGGSVNRTEVYEEYTQWCTRSRLEHLSNKAFYKRVCDERIMGIAVDPSNKSGRMWTGISKAGTMGAFRATSGKPAL